MLLSFLVSGLFAPPTVEDVDRLAKARDVAGLTALLAPLPTGARSPFPVLKSGGAYDVGKFGWRAYGLGPDYVVVSTPLTSEDVGEILLRRSGTKFALVPEGDSMGVKIARHSIDLRFVVPQKRAELTDRLTLESSGTGSFVFRMSPAYRVSEITDGDGKSVSFTQGGGVVLLKKGPKELTVRYAGTVDLPQYAGSISTNEATLVNDYWYPMIGRHPSPYDIAVHAPKEWTTVGQGVRVSDEVGATERTTKFRMDLPVVYFSVSSGPYRSASTVVNGRRYTAWSPRLSEDRMHAQAESYAPIIEFYSRSFGPTPFEGYGALDSPQYGGGALEAYSYATYGGFWGADAHEPAHTWWGGMINNTYLNSFWNESFAVFSDGLFHRESPLGEAAEQRQAFASEGNAGDDFNQVAVQYAGADRGPIASSMGYGKGAKVLGMLEQWLGTEVVVGAMREWVATQPKGEPGDWPDFERVVTKAAPGKDVKGFFDDWLRRPGYADFDATATREGNGVRFNLKWKGPRFRMPLDILFKSASGLRLATVWLDGKNDSFFVPVEDRTTLVSIDPWRKAVRKVASNEVPPSISQSVEEMPKFVDPVHGDWMSQMGGRGVAKSVDDPAGKFIVGSPETLPALRPLCEKAGFRVVGNKLAYRGTTIDLDHGGALALVDLGGGKRCVIGLGKTRLRPDIGHARTALVDDLGHFLRGETEPKTSGDLVIRL
jgi:hypothetical protein